MLTRLIKFLQHILHRMKRSEIILPGHYCSKASLDADSKEIVRILGRASREGYWITDDKKELPEYVLLEDYVPLDTLAAQPKQKFGTDIFRDFQEVVVSDTNSDDLIDSTETEDVEVFEPKTLQATSVNLHSEIREVLREVLRDIRPEFTVKKQPNITQNNISKDANRLSSETLSIINKASIVVLNDNYEKKYGDRPYKQHTIQLNLQLPINYDLEKLRQIIELFELDEREIAKYLAQTVTIDYDKITDNILQAMVTSGNNVNVQNHQRSQVAPRAVTPKSKTKSSSNAENQLDSGIKEIDGLLAKFYAQKPTELEKE